MSCCYSPCYYTLRCSPCYRSCSPCYRTCTRSYRCSYPCTTLSCYRRSYGSFCTSRSRTTHYYYPSCYSYSYSYPCCYSCY